MKRIRVAVIGGGAAGVCAGRNMVEYADKFEFTIFEQCEEVGGTWNYTDSVGVDKFSLPIHSSMYKNLRTNVPKEIMGFPDYPFPESGNSFTHHTNVLKYLKNYALQYNLYKHIKFLSHVRSVTPIKKSSEELVWKLLVTNLNSARDTEYEFDAVMVCNGHYAVPNIPEIPNMERFVGDVMHSHSYRDPSYFKDKTVAILGASSSGMDISIEVASAAKKIYMCHNLSEKHKCKLPENITQVPGIASASPNGFTLLDGTFIEADTLIYCTGYKFNFPFLTEKCNVRVEGNRVLPLYKHLIHMDFPSLCFIGLPFTVLPFPMFHFQVQYFLRTIDKTVQLPNREEMSQETESDFRRRINEMRMPPKHAHKMGPLQWDYFRELGNEAHFQTLPPVYKMIYEEVEKERKENVMWYKKEEYRVLSADEFIRTMPGPL